MKRRYIALDQGAAQALETAGVAFDRLPPLKESILQLVSDKTLLIWVAVSVEEQKLLEIIETLQYGLLLYRNHTSKLFAKLQKSALKPILVQSDSLAFVAFSHAIAAIERFYAPEGVEDFSFGDEDYFDRLPSGTIHHFLYAQGRHLKEAILQISYRIRTIRRREGGAFVLQLSPETPMIAMDEASEILEIAIMPEKPLFISVRYQRKLGSEVYVSAFIATSGYNRSEMEAKIDAQPTYLGKLLVIVDAFAQQHIDENQMVIFCQEFGIEPSDADRLYDELYVRSEVVSELLHHLKQTPIASERERLIADKVAEGWLAPPLLKGLVDLFSLDEKQILDRAHNLFEKSPQSL